MKLKVFVCKPADIGIQFVKIAIKVYNKSDRKFRDSGSVLRRNIEI